MCDLSESEKEIKVLENIEAIKRLKFSYWWCIDKKLWDELANCFTEDVILDNVGIPKIKGKKALMQYIMGNLSDKSVISVHQGHNPSIEITSDTTAVGTWPFHDIIIDTQANTQFRGWGFYEDQYAMEGGRWKIKSYAISRLLVEKHTTGVALRPDWRKG